MDTSDGTPPEAIIFMKLALGLIDASGGRATPVARHLNAAIEIAVGRNEQRSPAKAAPVEAGVRAV